MTYAVVTTHQADADLRSIYEYIAFELLAPDNAVGQLGRLEKHILQLADFPEKFSRYENEPWKSRQLRVMPVDNYLVLYIPDSIAQVVTVIRVLYEGMDVERQLRTTQTT